MINYLLALCGLMLTATVAGAGIIFSYGKNVKALTTIEKTLAELDKTVEERSDRTEATLARFGERIGRLEAQRDADREYTGRVSR